MRLLLRAYPTNEHSAFGRYAVVELDDEALKRIAARRKLFLAAHEQDSQLNEMYFWGSTAEFYGDNFDEDDDTEESFDGALDGEEWVEIPADFDTTSGNDDEDSVDRTDCDQLVVRKEGVAWYAADHYGDVTTMTVVVTYDKLFKDKL